jgi:hypothetical protein
MANLNGADIGTNYKGILNLDSTINTPLDATLRAVTDGEGDASPLQLSTDAVSVGAISGARLGIKGTGTTSATTAFLVQNSAGTEILKSTDDGKLTLASTGIISIASRFSIKGDASTGADNNIVLSNTGNTSFGMLKLGGTTNAFPAIKRNGAAIDFRLADDSAACNINTGSINTGGGNISTNAVISALMIIGNGSSRLYYANAANANLSVNATNITVSTSAYNAGSSASAVLEVLSTTQGFLPPRMTTTQKNAIATPATGLVLYDTTLNKLAVYTGSAWETVTSI